MKLRSPPGCGAASHAGFPIEIDADGYVDVDEDIVAALRIHGFEPASKAEFSKAAPHEASDDGIDLLKRGDLFARLKAEGISVSLPITNEELRRLVRLCAKLEEP